MRLDSIELINAVLDIRVLNVFVTFKHFDIFVYADVYLDFEIIWNWVIANGLYCLQSLLPFEIVKFVFM